MTIAVSLAAMTVHAEPLSLVQAEALLAARNREILAATRALEGARAGIQIAGQAPNPTFSYSATGIDPRNGVGSGPLKNKRIDQTLGVSQLIERGDKRELRQAGAEAAARGADDDLADTRRQQRLALHQAYFDFKAASERVALTADTAKLYQGSVAAAEKRLAVGDIAPLEVSRLRVEALRAENDARAAQADLVRVRRGLVYLIGEEARADTFLPVEPWPAPDTGRAADNIDPRRRPDVRAAEARVEAARQGRELARNLTTRDLTVGASVERNPPENGGVAGVTYGLSFSVPLFVRYGYEGEQAKAETDYTAAREEAERVVAQALNEIARAQSDRAAAADRLSRFEATALPEARKVAEGTEFAYKKGAVGLTDLLDARRTLRSIELDAVAARADYAKARAAWLAATEWEVAAMQEPTR